MSLPWCTWCMSLCVIRLKSLKEVVADECQNPCALPGVVRPEGSEVLRRFPGSHRGVCRVGFLQTDDVCVTAKFEHLLPSELLCKRVAGKQTLSVPRDDPIWALVRCGSVPCCGSCGVPWWWWVAFELLARGWSRGVVLLCGRFLLVVFPFKLSERLLFLRRLGRRSLSWR